jgi:hypothetical protein
MKPDETLKSLYELIDELLRGSNRGCHLDSPVSLVSSAQSWRVSIVIAICSRFLNLPFGALIASKGFIHPKEE